MIEHADILVRSFERDWLDVFIEFKGSIRDNLLYEWQLLRSEGPAGPFSPMTAWVQEQYHIRDNIAPIIHKVRRLYYVLDIRDRATQAVTRFGPSCLQAAPDLVGMEIIRQVRMELRLGAGRIAWVLPIRTFGQRCATCYDDISGVRTRSQCVECFDTSFSGGYLSPIETEIDLAEKDVEVVQTDMDQLAQSNATARMSNFPPVKPGDLLITTENERFLIEKVTPGSHRSAPYEQDLLLHELPRGDVAYNIPLDLQELQSFDADPDPRVRTYPASEEQLTDRDIVDMFGLFGGVRT